MAKGDPITLSLVTVGSYFSFIGDSPGRDLLCLEANDWLDPSTSNFTFRYTYFDGRSIYTIYIRPNFRDTFTVLDQTP